MPESNELMSPQETRLHAGLATAADSVAITNSRWVIYATFDAVGACPPFVAEQLTAYRKLGFETLVVDTSPTRPKERIECWSRCSTFWLTRPNVGYDFGSYRAGLDALDQLGGAKLSDLALVFANDSCYGPYFPLERIFEWFDSKPIGSKCVFGITESFEVEHHLQSYLLYFRPEVSHLARAFFKAMPEIGDRSQAIELGELRLSRQLLAAGCVLSAWLRNDDLAKHFGEFRWRPAAVVELAIRRWLHKPRYTEKADRACLRQLLGMAHACNPTMAYGSHLHFQGLSPFIKRQLIRDNPDGDAFVPPIPDGHTWDNVGIDRLLRSSDRYRRRYGGK